MATVESALPGKTEIRPVWAAWPRLLWLGLVLFAFLHVTMRVDMKALWWDESLSLQRAEESLPELIRGILWIHDGSTGVPTIDQHPFLAFLLQGSLIRLAGNDEFVLRYVSVIAATLMVPAVWVMARWMVRRGVAPHSTPAWAALLAAINPFLLWYGQEARPYALWAMLAVLATYLLLRSTDAPHLDRRFAAGFVVAELMFVTSHYYAVFLLPVHAAILFVWLAQRSLVRALIAAAVLLVGGVVVGLYATWVVVSQGGGQNFPAISLQMLVPDLLNAFSLGLSVDLGQVWWIDLFFGALALAGAAWGLRKWQAIQQGGWVLPACILVPIAVLLVLDAFHPLYMNARHLSLLVGPFLLLLSAGLALVWRRQRWVAGILVVGIIVASAYSTVNYFTRDEYAKDDYTRLGEYMDGRIMPGDAVLLYPPSSWRIFEYYLPLDPVRAAIDRGVPLGIYGVPRLERSWEETASWLSDLGRHYRRIWVVKSDTHPYFDLEGKVEEWLKENFLQVRNAQFFSHSSLRAQLYLPEIPVFDALPETVQNPLTVEFGNLIRLAGYSADEPAAPDLPSSVQLYWQVLEKPQKRYKYILQLAEQMPDGQMRVLSSVEREPYEGDIPTLYWDPGKTILEYVEFPPVPPATPGSRRFYTFQMYDAETLEKLPVTRVEDATVHEDGVTAVLSQAVQP